MAHILEDSLYLGNVGHAQNRKIFRNLRITHVVNATSEEKCFFEGENLLHQPEQSVKIQYLRIALPDRATEDIRQHFQKAIRFISEALADNGNGNGNGADNDNHVLVHCQAGVSRSSTITIAYLMAAKRMRYEDAYAFVKKKREVIWPNNGFIQQLKEFDKELVAANGDHNNITTNSSTKKHCIIL